MLYITNADAGYTVHHTTTHHGILTGEDGKKCCSSEGFVRVL